MFFCFFYVCVGVCEQEGASVWACILLQSAFIFLCSWTNWLHTAPNVPLLSLPARELPKRTQQSLYNSPMYSLIHYCVRSFDSKLRSALFMTPNSHDATTTKKYNTHTKQNTRSPRKENRAVGRSSSSPADDEG